MHILIAAATLKEIEPFVKLSPQTDTLITGVGTPGTIYNLQKRMQLRKYDLIIQAGIAGSFAYEFLPGQVVLVGEDRFGDLGIEEGGRFSTIFERGFSQEDEFPFKEGWLVNDHPFIRRSSMVKARGITVNKVSDDPAQNRLLLSKFNPDVETMEGAAFHYVCLMEKLPFLQIRAISNQVGERDRNKWRIPLAIDQLNTALRLLVDQLSG